MAANADNTTGDAAVAYNRVHNDYIWKIKQKINRLRSYMGDNVGRPEVSAATPLEPVDYATIPTIMHYYQMPGGSGGHPGFRRQ